MTRGTDDTSDTPVGGRDGLGYPEAPVDAMAARGHRGATGGERVHHGARH